MTVFNERDKSRTSPGFTKSRVKKVTAPPSDQNGWFWITANLYDSPAFQSLSFPAFKALFRLLREHIAHGGQENGKLKTTYVQFEKEAGISKDHVSGAIAELINKGFIRIERPGSGGRYAAWPTLYRLTFIGDYEGAQPTNEWQKICQADCDSLKKLKKETKLYKAKKPKPAKEKTLAVDGNHDFSPPPKTGVVPPPKTGAHREIEGIAA